MDLATTLETALAAFGHAERVTGFTPWERRLLSDRGVVAFGAWLVPMGRAVADVGWVQVQNGNVAAYAEVQLSQPSSLERLERVALDLLRLGEDVGCAPVSISRDQRIVILHREVVAAEHFPVLAAWVAGVLRSVAPKVAILQSLLVSTFGLGVDLTGDKLHAYRTGRGERLDPETLERLRSGQLVNLFAVCAETATRFAPPRTAAV